jgi:hypothetical protein
MQTQAHSDDPEFFSDVYRGRQISILNHYGRWHVYLDHILQHSVVFATAHHAVAWLIARVDQGIPGRLN